MAQISPHTSRVFAAMQIPLLVFILFIHTFVTTDTSHPVFWLDAFVTSLARSAVPCYFFISGYLLFAKSNPSSPGRYFHMLRKRVFSLLIPYLIWVSAPYFIAVIQGDSFGVSPREAARFFYSSSDYWYDQPSLMGYSFDVIAPPAGNYVMWYIRDLMTYILLSPLVRVVLVYTKKAAILMCITALLLNIGFAGQPATSIWPFMLGCAVAFNRTDFLAFCRSVAAISLCLWPLLSALYVWHLNVVLPTVDTSSRVSVLLLDSSIFAGGVAIFGSISIIERAHVSDPFCSRLFGTLLTLAPAGFFIYVTHTLEPVTALGVLTDSLVSHPTWKPIVSYFAFNALRLLMLMALYFMLARFLPKFTSLITGGRSVRGAAPRKRAGEAHSGSVRNASAASSAPGLCDTQTPDAP